MRRPEILPRIPYRGRLGFSRQPLEFLWSRRARCAPGWGPRTGSLTMTRHRRTPAYPEASMQGYNLHALPSVGRTYLIALAVLVAAFVTFYPLLDCGPGGCPEASQSSHAAHSGLSTTCLI